MHNTDAPVSRAAVRDRLKEFITAELMNKPAYPLADDEYLVTGGLIDSMAVVQVVLYVEKEFGVVIPDEEMTVDRMDTLGRILERVFEDLPDAV